MSILANTPLAFTAAGILALGAPALAQQPDEPRGDREMQQDGERKQPALQILKQDDVIGSIVTDGHGEARRVTLGTIADLVLDTGTGEIRHAILARSGTPDDGGERVAVPWNKLRRDVDIGFTLALTTRQLDQLPAFEPAQLEGLHASARAADAATDGARAARADDGKVTGERAAAAATTKPRSTLLLASRLDACPVRANEDRLGVGVQLFVETTRGQVAFLSMPVGDAGESGAPACIVPWHAATLVRQLGETDRHQVVVAKTREELEAAPQLGAGKADVNDPMFRQKLYDYFHVKRPSFEPKLPGAERAAGAGTPDGSR